jgi:hydroxymethylbilane synthase
LSGHATEILPREVMLPAVGQGALALECWTANEMVRHLVEPLHHPISGACVAAERAMLAALDGSCRTPIAGFAEIDRDRLTIEGLLLNEDGSREIRGRFDGGIDDAAQLGAELGKELRNRAGPDFGLG